MPAGRTVGYAHRRGFFWPRLALLGALAATPAWAQPPGTPAKPQSVDKWGASLDLEGKLGTDRNLGEGDLFLPLAQDERNLLFGDIRMRFDDANSREGNFGLGLRHMLGSGWNLGAYGYFDRRRSPYGNTFSQLTFGAEALGRDWDFRANSYWPVGDTTRPVDSLNTATLSGTSVIFRGGEEKALRGFDAEVGWRVPVFDAGGPLDLRVYAGGYTFDAADVPDVTGPRLRAELVGYDVPGLTAGTRVTLGTEWQRDDVRGSQAFFSLRLRIPLQSETQRSRRLTAQERRMTAPIVRDVDVVSEAGAYGPAETVTQTADGKSLTVLSSASTTGANLSTAVTNAGANSTVVLSGSFTGIGTKVALQSGQTLMGSGTVTVKSPSGRTAVLAAPGASLSGTGTVVTVGDNSSYLIGMADNSRLIGITANAVASGSTGALGVTVDNVSGAKIENSTISATATANTASAIYVINGSSNLSITGNTLSASSTTSNEVIGMYAGSSSNITFSDNSITASGTGNHRSLRLSNATGLSGSGNTLVSGACRNDGGNSGSIGFTDGSHCP